MTHPRLLAALRQAEQALETLRREIANANESEPCETPPRCEHGGFIYFFQLDTSGLPTKIGFTQDIANRLKAIRVSSPYEVRLVAFYWTADPKDEEAGLHEKFAELRLRGEWFKWNDELAAYAADMRLFKVLHVPHTGDGLWGALEACIGLDEEEEDTPP